MSHMPGYMRDPEGFRRAQVAQSRRIGYEKTDALDEALQAPPSPELAAFMATHGDDRHGAAVARKRARDRRKLPKFRALPRLTDAAAEREMRANWAAYGRGPYPGTPAQQAERQGWA